MPGQHAGYPGTAAAPTDLAASRSTVLASELRYFMRERGFYSSKRSKRHHRAAELAEPSRSKHSPAQPAVPMRAARVPPPLHNAGQHSSPRGHREPPAAPNPPRSSPRSAPGRWRPWSELSAERGSARPEWLRLNGSNMATSWKLPSAGTGRGAGRGGSDRRAVTVPSRGRPLRSGPGVPRAAACGRSGRRVPFRSAGGTSRSYEISAVTAAMVRVPSGPCAATTADAHRSDGGLRDLCAGRQAACRRLLAVSLPAA